MKRYPIHPEQTSETSLGIYPLLTINLALNLSLGIRRLLASAFEDPVPALRLPRSYHIPGNIKARLPGSA
jgi:hypothetical protein